MNNIINQDNNTNNNINNNISINPSSNNPSSINPSSNNTSNINSSIANANTANAGNMNVNNMGANATNNMAHPANYQVNSYSTNQGTYSPYNNMYADNPFQVLRPYVPAIEHTNLKTFKNNFPFFFWATVIYSVIYAICRYNNDRGITTPILVALSFVFFNVILKKIDISFSKKTYPYMVVISALGICNFCSDDIFIIVMNYIVALLLFVTFIIRNVYDCSEWTFSKHISSMLESTFGAIPHMFSQFGDNKDYKLSVGKADEKSSTTKTSIVLGVLISIGLLLIILPLLASADHFFGEAVTDFFNSIFNIFDDESNHTVIKITLFTIGVFFCMYGFIRKIFSHTISNTVTVTEKRPAAVAVTINSILGFIYVIFSGFQIYYLFLGRMTLPESATYAEYAHEGFFQLVVVCLINMIMVLIFINNFQNTMALKISLTVISASTYIMIASSALRMIMYVQAYDLSYLRLFVFWALIVIFMAMNGIVICTFKENFPLFKYLLVATTVLYVAFAYSNPTAIITRNNLERRYVNNGEYNSKCDLGYLRAIYNSGAAKTICDVAIEHNDSELIKYFYSNKEVNNIDRNPLKFNVAKLSEKNAVKKALYYFYN